MRRTVAVAVALTLFTFVSCKRSEKPAQEGTSGYSKTDTTQTQTPPPASSESAAKTDVGSTMPAYSALNLDGSPFDLAAKRDKVVLLNVWATWCGPCRYEIPELQKLHELYAPRGLEVVGVSVDESDAETVRSFVAEQKKMTYPIAHDAEGKIASLLETSVLPTTVVIDRNGKIVWKRFGAILEGDEELKKAIEEAL